MSERLFTTLLPNLSGNAYILDEGSGRYLVSLPDASEQTCVLEFYASSIPEWSDSSCVSFFVKDGEQEFEGLSICNEGSELARFAMFATGQLKGFFYAPSPVNRDSFDFGEYQVTYFERFDRNCGPSHYIAPGLVSQSLNEDQFISLIYKDHEGRNVALFADFCSVIVAKD